MALLTSWRMATSICSGKCQFSLCKVVPVFALATPSKLKIFAQLPIARKISGQTMDWFAKWPIPTIDN
jgi:hypothetical protein